MYEYEQAKVGALIIIERYVGLSEYIATGDMINANITQRLIENIFSRTALCTTEP